MNNKILIFIGIFIAIFFSFWQINEFPHDLNAEVILGADALRCLQRAHIEHIAPQVYFRQLCSRWETKGMTFRNYDASLACKLWLLVYSIAFKIFGYSVFSFVFFASIVGILVIFLTYRLGRLLYSQEAGILAGVFLSAATVYNMTVRASYGFTVITASSLLVYYYLYKYLISGLRRELIGAAIFLGIGSLSSPPQFFFIPFTAVLILLFDAREGEKRPKLFIKNIKNIAILLSLSAITSLVLTGIFAWYYNTSVFTIYNETYLWISQKIQGAQSTATHDYLTKGINDALKCANKFIKNVFAGMSPYDLDDYALQLQGVPMVAYLLSPFFIVGVFLMAVKRGKNDKLMLFWLGVNFMVYMFLIKVQTRFIEVFLPAIYITSAYGFTSIINKINFGKYAHKIRQLFYIALILLISFIGYREFFILYKNNDANLRRFYNSSKIADFVVKHSRPQDCLVILPELLFTHRDSVVFNMQYRPYDVIYLEEVLYKESQNGSITIEKIKEIINRIESEAIKDKKAIFYVFSEHDIKYYPGAMVPIECYGYVSMFKKLFLSLHPYAKPAKILYYSNGDPTHSIYIVNKAN